MIMGSPFLFNENFIYHNKIKKLIISSSCLFKKGLILLNHKILRRGSNLYPPFISFPPQGMRLPRIKEIFRGTGFSLLLFFEGGERMTRNWVALPLVLVILALFSLGCTGITKDTKIKCPKCGAVFTIQEGLDEIQKKGF